MSKPQAVSIRSVAQRAGVSVATVSNVINGKQNVSPLLVEKVKGVIRELGYVVNMNASRLRSHKAALVGVIVPDLTNSMFAAFVSTLERVARKDGFDLVVVSSSNDPAQEAERLASIRAWRPAGLIVIPCDGALAERVPAGLSVPIVVADRIPADASFDLVAVDNGPAACAIARHLAGEGVGSCIVVGTRLSISNVRERWEGALAGAGPMRLEMLEVGFERAALRERLNARLDGAPCEALFVLDHMSALAAYELLMERGLSVPRDIAFSSFDEREWMRLVSPPITAARQPVEEMALSAWSLLIERRREAGLPKTVRLRCTLEIRGSTLRCRTLPKNEAA